MASSTSPARSWASRARAAFQSPTFARFAPRPELRPLGDAGGVDDVRIRWLGTAGYLIVAGSTTIVIDPYLSRPSALALAALPLSPNEAALRAQLPEHIDAVLCGHSHFDHLLDAPRIASLTGAQLIGSDTTLAYGAAEGLAPDRLVRVSPGGLTTRVGEFEIRFVPSLHGRILFGRVPFPGAVSVPPRLPARAWHYRMGGAFGIWLRARDVSIYHNGSADLVDVELAGLRADVVLAGIAGRGATRDYVARLLHHLRPKVVLPCHHDAFFSPLERGVHLWPGIDLDGFVAEVNARSPTSRVVTPLYDDIVHVESSGASTRVEESRPRF